MVFISRGRGRGSTRGRGRGVGEVSFESRGAGGGNTHDSRGYDETRTSVSLPAIKRCMYQYHNYLSIY